MRLDVNRVARGLVELPRDVGQVFQTMTQTHMAFLRGDAMDSSEHMSTRFEATQPTRRSSHG